MKFLKTKEFQEKLLKVFILFVYLPLGLSLALLTPDNILDYRWARMYTDFMASWLPFVAEVGRWTKVPATQFIAAVMNAVAILLSLSLIYVNSKHYLEFTIKRLRKALRKEKMKLFACIFFIIACSSLIFFVDPIHNPPGIRDRTMIGSKLGMGIYGSLLISGWLLVAIVIVIIIAFFVMIKRSLMLDQE